MKNADTNIIEFYPITNTTNYRLFDGWSTGHHSPKHDTEIGGTDDIKNIQFSVKDGRPIISFIRSYSTGDKYDIDILKKGNELSVAWGKGEIEFHADDIKMLTFDVDPFEPEPEKNVVNYRFGSIVFEVLGEDVAQITINVNLG